MGEGRCAYLAKYNLNSWTTNKRDIITDNEMVIHNNSYIRVIITLMDLWTLSDKQQIHLLN